MIRQTIFPALLLCFSVSILGVDLKVELVAEKCPDVPAELAAALAPGALVIKKDGAALAHLWLRENLPLQSSESTELGIAYPKFQEGALVGVLRLGDSWGDFKGQAVKAGVYALRYGVQPADGNHMGVSDYRDFLLLIPLPDAQPLDAKLTTRDLLPLSRKASGTAHPSVMALLLAEGPAGSLSKNDFDQWVLTTSIKTAAGPAALALVVWGKSVHP